LLLTALVMALREWSGLDRVQIGLEGHGRVMEGPFASCDLSRTVGWFTDLSPVTFSATSSLDHDIMEVKKTLRSVPLQGALFSHFSPSSWTPSLVFNYLGQMSASGRGSRSSGLELNVAGESSGDSCSNLNNMWSAIEINGSVSNGELSFDVAFAAQYYRAESASRLASCFHESLRSVIYHCLRQTNIRYSASDFPLLECNQDRLDSIVRRIECTHAQAELEDIYPLSPLQEGMLFQSMVSPLNDPYTNQLVMVLEGSLNPQQLRRAWEAVVEANSVFRTGFILDAEEPVQFVLKPRHVSVPFSVVRSSGSTLELALSGFLKEDHALGFRFDTAPLLRVTIIDSDDADKHFVVLTAHHALLDGWSMPILYGQLMEAYENCGSSNGEWTLPVLRPYRDYIGWLRKQDHDSQLKYWQSELMSVEPCTLASAFSSPKLTAASGVADLCFSVSADRVLLLQKISKSQMVTLNTMVQSSLAFLIGRFLRRSSVAFGVTVSGRETSLAGHETMIGLFINTLPLVIQFESVSSASELLKLVQTKQRNLSSNSCVQLGEVQRLHNSSEAGLFDVLYLYENYPVEATDAGAGRLTMTPYESVESTEYPLCVTCFLDGDGSLQLKFTYHRSRLDSWAVESLKQSFLSILSSFEQPETKLDEVSAVSDAQRSVLLGLNQPFGPTASETIHRLFEKQVQSHSSHPAVRFADSVTDYATLNHSANRLSRYIRSKVSAKETAVIGVCVPRSFELVLSLVSVLKAGFAYLPLDPSLPSERLRYMIQDSGASLVISTADCAAKLSAVDVLLVDDPFVQVQLRKFESSNVAVQVQSDAPAYIIYTSGSTGRPKGVVVQHSSVVNLIASACQKISSDLDDVWLQSTGIGFDIAGLELYGPLLSGATLQLLSASSFAESVPQVVDLITKSKVTVVQATPSYWKMLLDYGWQPPTASANLKMLCGGEALSEDLKTRLLSNGARLHHFYGPTETTIWSTYTCLEASSPVTIGGPLVNTTLYVLDDAQRLSPLGAVGELCIGGDGVAVGYHNRADLTASKFISNPFASAQDLSSQRNTRLYRTGDLVRWREDGLLEYLGRSDFQVKIRGHRIELGEIEDAVRKFRGSFSIEEVVVSARVAQDGVPQLAAYVVVSSPVERLRLEAELSKFVTSRLPPYMVPSRFVPLERLPLNSNGKVDRNALPDIAVLAAAGSQPLNDVEQAIAEIFASLLSVEAATITQQSNFFTLGGHSLLVPLLAARINSRLGARLSLVDIMNRSTVSSIADVIMSQVIKSDEPFSCLIQVRSGADRPVFMLHPAGGLAFQYLSLRNSNIRNRPIFGLHSPRFGKGTLYADLDELVHDYCKIIKEKQPSGPYTLGGWSSGGMLALECARVLSAANERVDQVIMIDTPNFTGSQRVDISREKLLKIYLDDPETSSLGAEIIEGMVDHTLFTNTLLCAYQARPYDGNVSFMRAKLVQDDHTRLISTNDQDDVFYRWSSTLSNLEVCSVEGHHDVLFSAPYASPLCDQFAEIVNSASLPRETPQGDLARRVYVAARLRDDQFLMQLLEKQYPASAM
jgi:amino acid adenylation domain-containing protein/non-ribosomal peptide synthase protein (TIGR01720 family)